MLRELRRRVLALGLLTAYLAAPLSAIAVGLHVAGEDHDEPALLASLAMIATHGHDHHAATPEHEHSTVRSEAPQASGPVIASALLAPAAPEPRSAAPAFAPVPVPTGSPPLFCRHCALLL